MTKRFGRPLPKFDEPGEAPPAGRVRQINLQREGRALEGAYAEASIEGSQIYEADMMYSKKTFAATLVWWTCVAFFWIMVIWLVQNTR